MSPRHPDGVPAAPGRQDPGPSTPIFICKPECALFPDLRRQGPAAFIVRRVLPNRAPSGFETVPLFRIFTATNSRTMETIPLFGPYALRRLRTEDVTAPTGKIILTVAEDADCSGLPVLGETVCNYDEGFIAGILSLYSGKPYTAVEVDCWAPGDRVCRFHADVQE